MEYFVKLFRFLENLFISAWFHDVLVKFLWSFIVNKIIKLSFHRFNYVRHTFFMNLSETFRIDVNIDFASNLGSEILI